MGTGSLETVADVSLSADGGGGNGGPSSVVEGGIPKCEMDALLLGRTRVSAHLMGGWIYLSTCIQLEANKPSVGKLTAHKLTVLREQKGLIRRQLLRDGLP